MEKNIIILKSDIKYLDNYFYREDNTLSSLFKYNINVIIKILKYDFC